GLEIVEAATFDQVEAQLDLADDFDLVLMDFSMPNAGSVSKIQQLASRLREETPLIIISAHEDPALIRQCITAGANGFITKSAATAQMLAAIQIVLDGGVFLPPQLLRATTIAATTPIKLTARQREVLEHIARGLSNQQIADQLGIAHGTIKQHIAAIYAQLEVRNRAQAVLKAVEMGLSPLN
ncbi:MAG: response regulator transcription factor, partial [Mariprofundales bacterium]